MFRRILGSHSALLAVHRYEHEDKWNLFIDPRLKLAIVGDIFQSKSLRAMHLSGDAFSGRFEEHFSVYVIVVY